MSSIDELLARAPERIDRVEPAAALEEMRDGAGHEHMFARVRTQFRCRAL